MTAIDWSYDGKFIATGDRNGTCRILDASSLEPLGFCNGKTHGKKRGGAWIEDIKFSPDSSMVAWGTHYGSSFVEFAKINSQGKPTLVCSHTSGISSALMHLDWSLDGYAMVINSQAYELYFLSVNRSANGVKVSNMDASSAKNIEWKSWTSTLGFGVQGIWPGVDFTDVNSVCRSQDGNLLATGDDFGKVKLFKWPCIEEKADFNESIGHSSHVTEVRFSYKD